MTLPQITALLRRLPMDEEGRRAAEELIAGAEAEQRELVEALRDVESWWLEKGMHEPGVHGAPACIFTVRELVAKHAS